MKEDRVFESIMEMGKQRGSLTYEEINEAFSPDFYSPEEIEDQIDLLKDMGISVIDSEEDEGVEERSYEEEKGLPEDLVQTYFHSMGNITVLSRKEELKLARDLAEARELIKSTIKRVPLYKMIEKGLKDKESEEVDVSVKAYDMSIEAIEDRMDRIRKTEKKIARYGSLSGLRKQISESKKKGINTTKLQKLAGLDIL